MGLKEWMNNKLEENKKKAKERKEFLAEVNKETLQIRREEFKKESINQAKKQGKELAKKEINKPTFKEKVIAFSKKIELGDTPFEQAEYKSIKRKKAIPREKVDPFAPTQNWEVC